MFSFWSRRKPARRPSALLRLEALEDRWTPSVSPTTAAGPNSLFGPATIRFSPTQYSVAEDAGPAVVTVTRSDNTSGTVSVRVRSTGGSATPGVDYTPIDQILTFTDGETRASFLVPFVNDTLFEGNETITLVLTNTGSGGSVDIEVPFATVIIGNDEPQPPGVIQFGAPFLSVAENAARIHISVRRISGSGGEVSVRVRSADGSATAGSDYTAVDQIVTFADGQLNAAVTVGILNDAAFEGNETLTLTLSDPTGGASIGSPATTTLTINDDDAPQPPGVIQFGSAAVGVAENAGSRQFTLTRTGGSGGAVSVRVRSTGGTATAGGDYAAVDQVVPFANGQTIATFAVTLIDDPFFEGNETVTLELSDPTGGASIGTPSTATLTINDNDPEPPRGSVQFDSPVLALGENAGSRQYTLTRTGGSFGAGSVRVRSTDGTAAAGGDYAAVDQVVHFVDGQVDANFTVTLLDDAAFEGDETFTLTLSDPTGGISLGTPSTAAFTILDDDPAPPAGSIQFGDAAVTVDEEGGPATITVTRTDGSFGAVSVRIRSSDDSAEVNGDYVGVDQTVTFADGQTSVTVPLGIVDDSDYEGDESFTLTLSDPTGGGTIGNPSTVTVTINDNDPRSGDVTDQVQVSGGVFRRIRPGLFRQEVTLTNLGEQPIQGPLSLELTRLPGARWKLVQNPLAVPGPDNLLDPGESVSIVLVFRSKKARPILYSATVLANPEVIPT